MAWRRKGSTECIPDVVFITSSAALTVTKSAGARRFSSTGGYSTIATTGHPTCAPGCYFPCYTGYDTRT